jgi:hypothetical protein
MGFAAGLEKGEYSDSARIVGIVARREHNASGRIFQHASRQLTLSVAAWATSCGCLSAFRFVSEGFVDSSSEECEISSTGGCGQPSSVAELSVS